MPFHNGNFWEQRKTHLFCSLCLLFLSWRRLVFRGSRDSDGFGYSKSLVWLGSGLPWYYFLGLGRVQVRFGYTKNVRFFHLVSGFWLPDTITTSRTQNVNVQLHIKKDFNTTSKENPPLTYYLYWVLHA